MDRIYTLLNRYFGYKNLKEEQKKLIEHILLSQDCIGVLPTGYGKSIVFQLPALIFDGLTIVISPLIALMQDQVQNLKNKNIPAEYINSSQSYEEQEIIYRKILNKKIKILYVSAERLFTKKFEDVIVKTKVSFLVCDEAHTLLWSDDFRMALGHIPDFIQKLGYKPIQLALTATATKDTLNKIINLLNMKNTKIITGNCDRNNIFYKIIQTNNKINTLVSYIKRKRIQKGIIYCLTIKNCIFVYDRLKSEYKVGLYYGPMDSIEKEEVVNDFKKDKIEFIICTNAFGMGIDIPNIRYILLYDMPLSIEDFVQQTGRASRDGKYAEAILFFSIKDLALASYFIDNIENKEKTSKEVKNIKKDRYKKLDTMIGLCLTKKCIHQYIAKYFNQVHNGKCKMCSSCIDKM